MITSTVDTNPKLLNDYLEINKRLNRTVEIAKVTRLQSHGTTFDTLQDQEQEILVTVTTALPKPKPKVGKGKVKVKDKDGNENKDKIILNRRLPAKSNEYPIRRVHTGKKPQEK